MGVQNGRFGSPKIRISSKAAKCPRPKKSSNFCSVPQKKYKIDHILKTKYLTEKVILVKKMRVRPILIYPANLATFN